MAIEKPSNLVLNNVNNAVNLEWQDNQLSEVLGFKIKRNGVEIATIPQDSVIVKNGITNPNNGQQQISAIYDSSSGSFMSTINKSDYGVINSISTIDNKTTPSILVNYTINESIVSLSKIDFINIKSLSKISCSNNAIKLIFSVDNGVSWKSWDSINSLWQVVDINSLNDIKLKSNAIDIVNSLTSSQLELLRGASASIKLGYYIFINDANKYSNNNLLVEYTNIDNLSIQNKSTFNVTTGSKTSYIDLQPEKGILNTYEVYGFNGTEQSLVTSQSILISPDNVSELQFSSNGYNITYTWKSIPCDGYKIYDENDVLIDTVVNNSYIYTNNGQSEAIKTIKITAYNSSGESNKVSITGNTIPNSPSNLILSQVYNGFKLEWNNNSTLNIGFKIQKRISQGVWTEIGDTTSTTYTDVFVADTNTLYEYQVCAYNNQGSSAYATWGSYVVDSVVLSYTLEDSLDKITYYWDESIGSSRYKLFITDYNGIEEQHEVIGSTNYVFTINKEINQSAYVIAYIDDVNYGTTSSSDSNIVTVKSSPRSIVTDISCETDLGRNVAIITFSETSVIEDGFKLKYIKDDVEQIADILSTSTDSMGTTYSYEIDISNLTRDLKVNIAQYNSIGVGQYSSVITYIAPPKTIDIGYDSLTSAIKVAWIDTLNLADSYRLSYTLDGVPNTIDVTSFVLDGSNKVYSTSITANSNSQFNGFVYSVKARILGIKSQNIIIDCSTYIPISLTNDLSVRWIGDGIAEYLWTNDQSELYGYKFIYTINGGQEYIVDFKVSSINIGSVFSQTITVTNDLDLISAKIQGYTIVRETNYSNLVEVTYVKVDPLPVDIIKIRTDNGILIQWSNVEFLDYFEVHYIINNLEYIENVQVTEYNIIVNPYTDRNVEAYVIVKYTGGESSIPSNHVYLTPTTSTQNIFEIYYNKTEFNSGYIEGSFSNKRVSNKFYSEILTYTKNIKTKNILQTTSVNYQISSSGLICELDIAKTSQAYFDEISFFNGTKNLYAINTTTITQNVIGINPLETASCDRGLIFINPLIAIVKNRQVDTKHTISMTISTANLKQGSYGMFTIVYERVSTVTEPIHYSIYNKIRFDAGIYTDIHKIRVCCIGDSITAGHPGYWAENEVNHIPNSGTGRITSQYEYWLQKIIEGDYEVINNGYGSDTTERMLNRFDKDILSLYPQYCIIQGGTNDINWAMVENKGNQDYLDNKMSMARNNIIAIVDKCLENNIIPIVGTLIPRTSAQGIYRQAIWDYNEWIIDYCNSQDGVYYADFYNAGKDNIPPMPLEEPGVAGNLNPLYDGDSVFDTYGNLVRRGYGVHPNDVGYKLMAEAVPLNIFRGMLTGIKLYVDENCTIEEDSSGSDIYESFYNISFNNLDRGRVKTIIRYIKNIGNLPILFSMYLAEEIGVTMQFSLDGINFYDSVNGKLDNETINKIYMRVTVPRTGVIPTVSTVLSTRSIKVL